MRVLTGIALLCLVTGCSALQQVRIHNQTGLEMTEVTLGGTSFEPIAVGELTEYRATSKTLGYTSLRMTIKDKAFTGQTLYFSSRPVAYRIGMKDFEKRHLNIELVKEDDTR